MNRVKQLVHAENVYRMGYTGKNIRVVTLDTGVYLHPDLRQNVVGFLDFVAMKRACYDDNGHGTHVGGILCANGRMKGMAPQAQLIALKVLGKDGGGQTERVIRGLQWVLAHHKELGIRILNFSVGFLPGALDREQKQIMELLERSSPGERRGGYSGSGPTGCCIMKPEILAPGTNIVSLDHHGALYSRKSGTSMATPVVCGALALALQKNPKLRPEELKLKLYESARKETGMSMAWGVLDVDNLLALV